jgi:hypothetical protein
MGALGERPDRQAGVNPRSMEEVSGGLHCVIIYATL